MAKKKHKDTIAVRTQLNKTEFNEHSVPLYLTSSFVFDDAETMRAMFADEKPGNIYSRFSNPNTAELVEKICLLENAEAGVAMASGMATVFTTFAALLKSGDHLLCCNSVFGATHTVLEKNLSKFGISHTYVDIHKPNEWSKAIKPNTKIIFVETPSNPAIDLIDLEWLGKFSAKHKTILIVDNCFATPILQQPIDFGADLVIHSATKYLDGQGRVLGGIVVGKKNLIDEIRAFARSTGPSLSPFNAWILSKSIETLSVRMDRHSSNALKVAEYLEKHLDVESVKYPFLKSHPQYKLAKKQMTQGGGMIAFLIKGGLKRGKKFLDALEMASMTANLGDTRTIVSHPASTTHAKLTEKDRVDSGVLPGLIRISAGLEHIDDIIADLDQAFKKSK
ncbi:MAG TPA: aminotransferase class I/II-fold pyridoxal phosphate-dependent enzyme [Bacteroidia bacterium]|jgi:O-succinylhomoserine sulfhydrylase|nr:aminotransferase class I/II-fold pyridoxal phosphate-dependent enzyme [Bacteroidia bacterium]